MARWTPFRYRGFWDVPRVILVRNAGATYLLSGPFDEELDDYPDDYAVYLMPELPDDVLPQDWTRLAELAVGRLGSVPVSAVRFDVSRKAELDCSILDQFATPTVEAASRSG